MTIFNRSTIQPVSTWRAVLAGLAGAIANSLAIQAFQRAHIATGTAGLSKLMFAMGNRLLDAAGASFRFPEKLAPFAQEAFHTLMGVLMALAYAWIFIRWLPGPGWVRGILFSLLPWLLQSLVVAPYMGFGYFCLGLSPAAPFVSLGLNVLYGLTVGACYRPKEGHPGN